VSILGYENRDYIRSGHKLMGFLVASTVLALLWPLAIFLMIWIYWPRSWTGSDPRHATPDAHPGRLLGARASERPLLVPGAEALDNPDLCQQAV
jgi:hypothetical protein